MKQIYAYALSAKIRIILLSGLLGYYSITIQAQNNENDLTPGTAYQIDSAGHTLKSTNSMTWNALSNGSDYYIYYTWSGATVSCDCDKYLTMNFYNNGAGAGSFKGVPSSYSGSGHKYALGAYQTGKFTFNGPYSGHNNVIILGCIDGCSGHWYSNGSLTRSTSYIKAPKNVKASENETDTSIVITWEGQTDIPVSYHGYRIYRDNELIYDKYNSSTKKYTDTGLKPGETHYYTIETYTNSWGGQTSYRVGDYGSTFSLNPEATTYPTYVVLKWTDPSVIGADKLRIERTDSISSLELAVRNLPSVNYTDDKGIPGFNYTYILTPLKGTTLYKSATVTGSRKANGKISGEVKTISLGGVDSVIVCAERLDDVPQGEITTYCDTTDASGYFEINNIYYYQEAKFRITPTRGIHGFNPGYTDRTLDLDNHSISGLNFTDTSSFTVSGRIIQVMNGDTCNVKGAELWIDDIYRGVKTDENGEYKLTVDHSGKYTITPKLDNHSFNPASKTYTITEDLQDVNFADTTTYVLEGKVQGSCGIYIGYADLHIYSQANPSSCFDVMVTTDHDSGYYRIRLPARDYYVALTKFYPQDPQVADETDVENYFNTQEAMLGAGNVKRNFIYRKAPSIQVTGFYNIGCGDYDNIPVVEQGQVTQLIIEVVEAFGEQQCLTDTGFVVVYDGLVNGAAKVDTLYLNGGRTEYDLIPGDPNIIAPYLKTFEITANIEGQTASYHTDALIVGNHPREKTFVSVSPEIPFMILRDPPGDASYSFMSKGTTTETALSFMAKAGGSVNRWGEVKAGVKFEAGFGVEVETSIWGKIKSSLEVGASITSQNEFKLNFTSLEDFSTSGNQDITGEEGDVFVGSSLNLIYALTDIIEYDSVECKVNKSVDIIMGTEGFHTTFMYTGNHIRNVLIPQLTQLRDIYQAAGTDDSVAVYNNQIKVWEQTLNINGEQKKKAAFIENRSFSAGAQYQSSQEVTRTSIGSIEFNMYIDASVAAEAGIEIGGVGASGGVETHFRMDLGGSKVSTTISSTKTGYVLNDDDVGDFFSVDILADQIYGTPVFKLVSGRSKCPWEPGTQPREGVQLLSEGLNKFVDDPNGQAVFRLNLGNTSQSDESFVYNLVFLQESNPDGAQITLGGSPVQGGILTPYNIPAQESRDATITVKKGPLAFDYNGLEFALLSSCQDKNIADTVSLNVHFKSTCSNITLSKPLQGWLINQADSSILRFRFDDYDLSLLTHVNLQYSPAGKNNWVTDVSFDNTGLNEGYTVYDWAVPEIPDGTYDVRASVECTDGYTYSNILTGTLDRTAPKLYGIPEPTDGVFDKGDIISATFDEDINCDNFNASNVMLTDLNTKKQYDVEYGCADRGIILLPLIGSDVVSGDTFRVTLMKVTDIADNVSDDTVSWTFLISGDDNFATADTSDIDGDGIPDKHDNCKLTYNPDQSDLDKDGIGDVCDDDVDGDGISNALDNCKYIANPDQADSDSNGIGDVCEGTFDGDKDGVINEEDNCPYTYNPDQADEDKDGIGDVCDDDIDGDGVINVLDNCKTVANPGQTDSNHDGIGNACQSITTIVDAAVNGFRLLQNYPNPFSDFTTIKYMVPIRSQVVIRIYSLLGRESIIESATADKGMHEVTWQTKNNPDGVYFYSIYAKSEDGKTVFWDVKKLIIESR